MTADSWELDLKLDRNEFMTVFEALALHKRFLKAQEEGEEDLSVDEQIRLQRIDALLDRLRKEAP